MTRAAVVDQGAHAAVHGAGDERVPDLQRAVLNQHGRHTAPAFVDLGFQHDPGGEPLRIGLEVLQVGDQENHLEQKIEVGLHLGRNRDRDDVAAPVLGQQALVGERLLDPVELGAGLVDLVDRHHDRDVGRLGVVDGFDRLRHDAVVGRDDQHDDVGRLGAAGAHQGEGLVTRRVEEDDAAPLDVHVVGADVLRDAPGLGGGHIRLADRVEQRGLAVVDVAHDGDHRRPRPIVLRIVGHLLLCFRLLLES